MGNELKERDEFEHARNDDSDRKAGAKPWPLDLRHRHQPFSQGDLNRSRRVVGLTDEEEEEQRDGTGNSDRTQPWTPKQRNHASQPQRKKKEEMHDELDEVDDWAAAAPSMVGDVGERGEALSERWMAAAVEVVKLISVETQGAIGCKMKGNDAERCAPKEKRSC